MSCRRLVVVFLVYAPEVPETISIERLYRVLRRIVPNQMPLIQVQEKKS